mmetsp:Transcript_15605/g.39962  ORF Transcript_15605/g.39962 Transcript_15605/m.39962 type:complete len:145 (+) Transcript_15605:2891-3325(+)
MLGEQNVVFAGFEQGEGLEPRSVGSNGEGILVAHVNIVLMRLRLILEAARRSLKQQDREIWARGVKIVAFQKNQRRARGRTACPICDCERRYFFGIHPWESVEWCGRQLMWTEIGSPVEHGPINSTLEIISFTSVSSPPQYTES